MEQVERIPWWLGFGIPGWPGGTRAFNGSHTGGVRIDLDELASGKVLGIPMQARTIYLSLEHPDGFVSEVRSALPR